MRVTSLSNGQWSVRGDNPRAPSVTVTDFQTLWSCSEHGYQDIGKLVCWHVGAVLVCWVEGRKIGYS